MVHNYYNNLLNQLSNMKSYDAKNNNLLGGVHFSFARLNQSSTKLSSLLNLAIQNIRF